MALKGKLELKAEEAINDYKDGYVPLGTILEMFSEIIEGNEYGMEEAFEILYGSPHEDYKNERNGE